MRLCLVILDKAHNILVIKEYVTAKCNDNYINIQLT
jgi:hypothetical protein